MRKYQLSVSAPKVQELDQAISQDGKDAILSFQTGLVAWQTSSRRYLVIKMLML